MGLKHHTVILVPHARARFRKFRVTNRQLAMVGAAVVLLAAASIFTTWSFFTSTIDRQELADLASENDELRQVNREFEDSVRRLQKQLGEFEERTRQLAIVAGLESVSGDPQAGVGGDEELASAADLHLLRQRAESLDGEMELVASRLGERQRLISSTPAIAPVKGILTSGFGYRRDPVTGRRALHRAIDISTAPGKPVKATADGIVVQAERLGRLGRAVVLSHGYGLATSYGHLSRFVVQPGAKVRRGDVIGYVGNSGRTTGYHLHYEVRLDGRPVDPLAYILDGTS